MADLADSVVSNADAAACWAAHSTPPRVSLDAMRIRPAPRRSKSGESISSGISTLGQIVPPATNFFSLQNNQLIVSGVVLHCHLQPLRGLARNYEAISTANVIFSAALRAVSNGSMAHIWHMNCARLAPLFLPIFP
jgi:hypothetical protein